MIVWRCLCMSFPFRDVVFLRATDVEDCVFEFYFICHRECRLQLALMNEVCDSNVLSGF